MGRVSSTTGSTTAHVVPPVVLLARATHRELLVVLGGGGGLLDDYNMMLGEGPEHTMAWLRSLSNLGLLPPPLHALRSSALALYRSFAGACIR